MRYFTNEKGQAQPAKVLPLDASVFSATDKTAVTWLGNAGVLLNIHGTTLLIDPLLMGFDMPLLFDIPLKAEDVPSVDAYLVTHIDNDHFSRETCQALLPVCRSYHSTEYVAEEMNKLGIPGEGHGIGDKFTVGNAEITLTPAKHNWQEGLEEFAYRHWKEEEYCGYWFDTPEGSIWLPGDSQLMECQLKMPEPDMILFDFSDSEWHITLDGAKKLANAYPDTKLLCIHWGTVDAPGFTPFCGDPANLFTGIVNPERILVAYPGETITL